MPIKADEAKKLLDRFKKIAGSLKAAGDGAKIKGAAKKAAASTAKANTLAGGLK